MPCASRLCVLVALGLALLLSACGGDDDGDPTPTPTATASPATGTPASTGDVKTPGPDESPDGGQTPAITATPPPPATSGTPAPRIEDIAAFFAQFSPPPEDERVCSYNLGTRLVDCSDRGVYAPNPPPVGEGTECYLMVSGGSPAALRCQIAEPQSTSYYDARG